MTESPKMCSSLLYDGQATRVYEGARQMSPKDNSQGAELSRTLSIASHRPAQEEARTKRAVDERHDADGFVLDDDEEVGEGGEEEVKQTEEVGLVKSQYLDVGLRADQAGGANEGDC